MTLPTLVLTRDLGVMRAPLADYLARARPGVDLVLPPGPPQVGDPALEGAVIVISTVHAYCEVRAVLSSRTDVRFIVIVDMPHFRPELVLEVRDADALVGSLGDADAILTAIDAVIRGGGVVDKAVFDLIIEALREREFGRRDRPAGPLTEREQEIISLVGGGLANKAIARTLGISVVTVNAHLRSIYAKLGARNRMDAVNRWKSVNGEEAEDGLALMPPDGVPDAGLEALQRAEA